MNLRTENKSETKKERIAMTTFLQMAVPLSTFSDCYATSEDELSFLYTPRIITVFYNPIYGYNSYILEVTSHLLSDKTEKALRIITRDLRD